MKQNLQLLKDAIDGMDNDSEKSLYFYNNPPARIQFILEVLSFSTHKLQNLNDPIEIKMRTSEIVQWLDKNFQGYGWPAHEVHFHTNCFQHCSCPFTCMNEISTMMEKLIKEKFAS